MNVEIRPLSPHTLPAAIALVDRTFPHQRWWERASWAFRLSLQPTWLGAPALAAVGVRRCRYWVAMDSSNQLQGVTGLYMLLHDSHSHWLGWTCVAETMRGHGLGKLLLEHAISQATLANASCLKLYTSDLSDQIAAVHLYERRGFQLIRKVGARIGQRSFNTLYYQLNLPGPKT